MTSSMADNSCCSSLTAEELPCDRLLESDSESESESKLESKSESVEQLSLLSKASASADLVAIRWDLEPEVIVSAGSYQKGSFTRVHKCTNILEECFVDPARA